MTEIRDILGKALPDLPPATSIDRDTAIAAGRRARTRRTRLITATAGISTLLVGATVAGGLAWAQAGGSTVDAAATSTAVATPTLRPSPTPSTTPDAVTSPGTPSTDSGPPSSVFNVKPALTAAFKAAMTRVASGVTSEPTKEAFANQDVGAFVVVASQGGFKTFAELRDSQGVGHFFAYMSTGDFAGQVSLFSTACASPPPGSSCTNRTGPNGELILIQETHASAITTYSVSVAKPDGTAVDALVDNYSHNAQLGVRNPHPDRATPPLSVEQIISLLLAPGVTLAS